jgi:hypothetical protein
MLDVFNVLPLTLDQVKLRSCKYHHSIALDKIYRMTCLRRQWSKGQAYNLKLHSAAAPKDMTRQMAT